VENLPHGEGNPLSKDGVTGLSTFVFAQRPTVETRNRKPMRPNPMAPWELRIGILRVYYDVEEEPEPVVRIHAVGIKQRNRVRIGREVVEL